MSNFDQFVGTRPVSEQHAFDTEALTVRLSHACGLCRPAAVEMFRAGSPTPPTSWITPAQLRHMRSAQTGGQAAALGPRHRA